MMMGNYLSDYSAFPSSTVGVEQSGDGHRNKQKTTPNASNNAKEVMDANNNNNNSNNNNNNNNHNNNNNNNNNNNKLSTAIPHLASSVRRSSDSLIAPSPSPAPSPAPANTSSSYTSDQPFYDYDELYRASTIYPQRISPNRTSVPLTHPIMISGHCMYTDLIHTHPRILAVHNFLSADECDSIIRYAEPRLKRSGVGMLVDQSSGMEQSSISGRRTSSTAGFARQENQLIALIEARLMALVACPLENIEPLQVVSYAPGQFYKAHYDTKPADHLNSYDGGLRLHTILVYLTEHDNDDSHLFDNNHNNSNPSIKSSSSISIKPSSRSPSPPPPFYQGKFRAPSGSTFFPKLGLRIRPTKGMAIWWRNVLPANKESSSSSSSSGYLVDTRTLHAGEPPLSGKKYAINCWIREKPFVVSINNATAVHSPAPIPIMQVNHANDGHQQNRQTGTIGGNAEQGLASVGRSFDLIDDMHLHQQNINPSNHKPASSHF